MAKQKYFLRPNDRICKIRKDLKGGKCEVVTENEYKELTEEQIEIFEVNIPFYLTAKRLVTEIPAIKEADGKDSEKTKSDKRIALEKEATELEIDFTDKTAQKDLIALISAKKDEILFDKLKEKAIELEIDFNDDVTFDDLAPIVDAKIAELEQGNK